MNNDRLTHIRSFTKTSISGNYTLEQCIKDLHSLCGITTTEEDMIVINKLYRNLSPELAQRYVSAAMEEAVIIMEATGMSADINKMNLAMKAAMYALGEEDDC